MAAQRTWDVDNPDPALWVTRLREQSANAHTSLHQLLLRVARAEISRRSGQLRITGPELDDLAFQATADAMISILRKLDTFRGESRFTTWACKFVIFEVSKKMGRHFWVNPPDRLDTVRWERLPDQFGYSPEDAARSADLFETIRSVVQHELTAHQREVFVAVVVNGHPLDAVCEKLGTNRNAIYKAVYDARRKIYAALVDNGYIEERHEAVRRP